jgi:hypothetical protein
MYDGQTPLRAYKQIGISMQQAINTTGARLSHYPVSDPTIPTVIEGASSAGFVVYIESGTHNGDLQCSREHYPS